MTTAARPETGANAERWQKQRALMERCNVDRTAILEDLVRNRPGVLKNYAISYEAASEIIDIVAERLVPPTHAIIPRSYLDALTALLEAGDSRGGDGGVWFPLGKVQDVENERDAAREEMGE